jgi:hypothetical protein
MVEEFSKDAEQNVDALARDGAADVEEFGAGAGGAFEHASELAVGGGIGIGLKGGVNAIVDDGEAVGSDERVREDFVASDSGVASDVRGLPQTGEDAAGHGAKWKGARFGLRREQTAKRVEVVAGDDGPVCR